MIEEILKNIRILSFIIAALLFTSAVWAYDLDGDLQPDLLLYDREGVHLVNREKQSVSLIFKGNPFKTDKEKVVGVVDLDGDQTSEVIYVDAYSLRILNYDNGKLKTIFSAKTGDVFGDWRFDLNTNKIEAFADVDGDGDDEILISSPWGIALLEFDGQSLNTKFTAQNGTVLGNWRIDTSNNIFPVVLDSNGDSTEELVVTSPWGIGLLEFNAQRKTLKSKFLAPNGTVLGAWRIDTRDNQFYATLDVDGDYRQELMISSPWGLGLLEFNDFQGLKSKWLASNGTILDDWRVDSTFPPFVIDIENDGMQELLFSSSGDIRVLSFNQKSFKTKLSVKNGDFLTEFDPIKDKIIGAIDTNVQGDDLLVISPNNGLSTYSIYKKSFDSLMMEPGNGVNSDAFFSNKAILLEDQRTGLIRQITLPTIDTSSTKVCHGTPSIVDVNPTALSTENTNHTTTTSGTSNLTRSVKKITQQSKENSLKPGLFKSTITQWGISGSGPWRFGLKANSNTGTTVTYQLLRDGHVLNSIKLPKTASVLWKFFPNNHFLAIRIAEKSATGIVRYAVLIYDLRSATTFKHYQLGAGPYQSNNINSNLEIKPSTDGQAFLVYLSEKDSNTAFPLFHTLKVFRSDSGALLCASDSKAQIRRSIASPDFEITRDRVVRILSNQAGHNIVEQAHCSLDKQTDEVKQHTSLSSSKGPTDITITPDFQTQNTGINRGNPTKVSTQSSLPLSNIVPTSTTPTFKPATGLFLTTDNAWGMINKGSWKFSQNRSAAARGNTEYNMARGNKVYDTLTVKYGAIVRWFYFPKQSFMAVRVAQRSGSSINYKIYIYDLRSSSSFRRYGLSGGPYNAGVRSNLKLYPSKDGKAFLLALAEGVPISSFNSAKVFRSDTGDVLCNAGNINQIGKLVKQILAEITTDGYVRILTSGENSRCKL